MIGWGQTVHQCLSSFRMAGKRHRVPGRRVIYLPDFRERGQQEDTLSQRISPCPKRSSFVGAGRLDHRLFPIFRYSCILHTLTQGFRKESRLILTHLKDWFLNEYYSSTYYNYLWDMSIWISHPQLSQLNSICKIKCTDSQPSSQIPYPAPHSQLSAPDLLCFCISVPANGLLTQPSIQPPNLKSHPPFPSLCSPDSVG